jgi:tRNA (guanine37-N1)-methyltransferase
MNLKLDGYRLRKVAQQVGIPLVNPPSAQNESVLRRELGEFRIQESSFEPAPTRPRTIRDAVGNNIPAFLLSELPRSLDVVGDIAIVELSPKLEPYSLEVANAVLQVNPHVRLVMKKATEVTGVFRTRGLEALAGTGGTETTHREFGCDYRLDASQVYFNPRLAQERRRVAEQVTPGEVVVDMFSGVGPYSILIAKLQPKSRVYAIDINPNATKYLRENILANGVADRVIPLQGDARTLSRSVLQGSTDRVIMNLPSEAEHYLDVASDTLRPAGGHIHFYQFINRGVELKSVREYFEKSLLERNRSVQNYGYCNVVREISPSRVQIAIDALVR